MSRCAAWIILALVCLGVCSRHALAQGRTPISVQASFGFDNHLLAERWSPVRFTFDSPSRSIAGLLTVSHRQDGSQDASVSMPVSITQGQPTTIEILLCLPRFAQGVTVSLRDANSGRVLFTDIIDLERGSADRISLAPPVVLSTRASVPAFGIDDAAEVGRVWSGVFIGLERYSVNRHQEPKPVTAEERALISPSAVGSAPSAWAGYDSALAVAISTTAFIEMSERQRRALLDWLHGGGQLVLLIDDNSEQWRSLLPLSAAAPRVLPTEAIPSATLFDAIALHAELLSTYQELEFTPADRVNARPIVLSTAETDLGWRSIIPLPDRQDAGLAAVGPAGFGWITILGFDPASASLLKSRLATAAAWGAVLSQSLSFPDDAGDSFDWGYYSQGSGGSAAEVAGLRDTVNSLVDAPGIGLFPLLMLLGVMGVALLGIGPIDAIVLKRLRLRHWSWLTAIGWISLASVLTASLPSLWRSSGSSVARLTVTDAMLDTEGEPITSWSTGVTVSYASKMGRIGPVDDRAGAWWRGISPLESWQYQKPGANTALSPLRLTQTQRVDGSASRLSTLLSTPTQRNWTVRALLDQAPSAPAFSAKASRDDAMLTVQVRALRPEVSVTSIEVFSGGSVQRFNNPDLSHPLVVHAPVRPAESTDAKERDVAGASGAPNMQPVAARSLPGAYDRLRAREAYARSASYAVLAIEYTASTSDIEIVGSDTVSASGSARLIIPIASPRP